MTISFSMPQRDASRLNQLLAEYRDFFIHRGKMAGRILTGHPLRTRLSSVSEPPDDHGGVHIVTTRAAGVSTASIPTTVTISSGQVADRLVALLR